MRSLLLVSALAAMLAGQTAPPGARKIHPKLEASIECATCHDEIAAVWNKGKHGVAQVKCVTCHGWPGEKFTAKPPSITCRSCHPAQFGRATRNCAGCHPEHSLSPHSRGVKGGHQ